ncbi:MAG: hypothetical protein H7A33_00045 [Deltaproteobacteria bacterium]|nr:hypothetical protein [Deltaproteobacteria bacterium]
MLNCKWKNALTSGFAALSALLIISCGSATGTTTGTTSNLELSLSTASSSQNGSISGGMFSVTASEDYCRAAESGGETQDCFATPENYNLGVLAVYLVECTDDDGNALLCTSSDVTNIERTAIYNGTQVDTTVTDAGTDFAEELNEISSSVEAGGIQIVTAYIEQVFPEVDESVDNDADKFSSNLQGVTYRICQTDEDEVDADTMETRCGNAEARRGDYLMDIDGDGIFGFIDVDTLTTSNIEETSTRPDDYNDFNDENFVSGNVCFGRVAGAEEGGDCSEEYTTASIYGTPGYFAPLMSFSAVQTFDANTVATIAVEFDITNSFMWTDGSDGPIPSNDVCVGAVSDTCTEGSQDDDDSTTVGVYNVLLDNAFLPQSPTVSLTVAE